MASPDGHSGDGGRIGRCCSIYGRLGHTKGPSVTWGVLLAFGLPILVFIVSLAVAGALLGGFNGEPAWPAALSLVIALVLTAAVVLVIQRATQRPIDNTEPRDRD